jgi:hypothetical protein
LLLALTLYVMVLAVYVEHPLVLELRMGLTVNLEPRPPR